jgi:N-acetylmuramoyl-L-alanine amidase/Putative peptidoglycan binding domain
MTDHQVARRAVLRGGIGLAVAGSAGVFHVTPAAAVSAPTIYGTSAWGARPPSAPITVLSSRPTMVIVHHTATSNSTDYSQAHAFSLARSIQNYHMDHNGWIDTGQQFTISRGGYIMEGRHRSKEVLTGGTQHVRGAHTSGQNDYAVGIENEGTYITAAPTTALWNSLVNQIAYICQQYAISPSRIFGHRDYNNTQCPGDRLYSMLPQLRDQVAAKLGQPNPPDPVQWPLVRQGDSGERVRSVQYLLRQFGRTEVTPDGIFGPITDTAVRAFQSSRGLTVDGMVGSETWPALIVTVRNGSVGEAVRGVQSQLRSRGYSITVDGIFGSQTETAVRSFQSSRGLTVDGIVGPITWKYLVN